MGLEYVGCMNMHLYVEVRGGCHVSYHSLPYFSEAGAFTEPGVDWCPASPRDPSVSDPSTGVTSMHSHAWVFTWVLGSRLRSACL